MLKRIVQVVVFVVVVFVVFAVGRTLANSRFDSSLARAFDTCSREMAARAAAEASAAVNGDDKRAVERRRWCEAMIGLLARCEMRQTERARSRLTSVCVRAARADRSPVAAMSA